jgi:hypothetical protein
MYIQRTDPSDTDSGRGFDFWRPFRGRGTGSRARRREQAIDEKMCIGDIRWQWRQACRVTGLGRLIYTPSGPTMSVPRVGRVTLGSPTTLTVALHPGQLPEDVEQVGRRIAVAMGVAEIRVRPLAAEWIVVELHTAPARSRYADQPEVVALPQRTLRMPADSAATAA